MNSLLPRLQRDLLDFIRHDPEELTELLEFWYRANSGALSAALTAQDGVNLMVNVSSFQSFETLAKKLFLVADTLVLRDTRKWTQDEAEAGGGSTVLMPPDGEYKPDCYDDIIDDLRKLRPSPLTCLPYNPESTYGSCTMKEFKNGRRFVYAVAFAYNRIPKEFVDWISTSGRGFMETGQIVYAPFIPPLDWELEFLKHDVNLPDYFNATPTFHQQYDWLSPDHIRGLLSLQFPFLDGIDVETLSKVKEDHRDEFLTFSRTLLSSISGIKSAFGTEGFIREVKYIQKNQIDAGISDVEKTVKRIQTRGTWQKGAILTRADRNQRCALSRRSGRSGGHWSGGKWGSDDQCQGHPDERTRRVEGKESVFPVEANAGGGWSCIVDNQGALPCSRVVCGESYGVR